ncbi:hypothetical protein [Sphingomonas sp.]|uniref:hypothetical protein n=1 Tax=Sphingomonas sp. TaxID=28214 RepID=UPI003B00957B
MGDEAAGDDGAAHVAVPLSPEERDRIHAELSLLSPDVVGPNVDRLIELVEIALGITTNDLFDRTYGPPTDEDEAAARVGTSSFKLEEHIRALLTAAQELDEQIRRVGADDRAMSAYEVIETDPLRHALAGLKTRDRLFVESAAPLITEALANLRFLSANTESRSTLLFDGSPAWWLVRAVMFYRHEQGLPLTNTWSSGDAPKRKFARRGDRDLAAGSAAAKLVEGTAKVFQVTAKHGALRHAMNEYAAVLKASNRSPKLSDFDNVFRHVRS